jgi:hypothetical protein
LIQTGWVTEESGGGLIPYTTVPDSGSDLCDWREGHQQYIKWRVVARDVEDSKGFLFVILLVVLLLIFPRLCSMVSLRIISAHDSFAVYIVVKTFFVKGCWGPGWIKQSFRTMRQNNWTRVWSSI